MNNLNDEYYILYPANNNNYPMLISSLRPRSLGRAVTGEYTVDILLDDPQPRNPKYVDYHTSGGTPVISSGFTEALNQLNIPGIQCLKGTGGDVITELKLDYYLLHIHNLIRSMDIKNSKVDYDKEIEAVCDVKSFVLDSEALSQIPLDQRLIFRMEEYPVYNLFHQSVVDHLSKYSLEGMRFIPVTHWNDNARFKP
jgi:hypothetical protein